MYGDGFANLGHINQYFASIATDPNYDLDELCHLRRATEDKNVHSGAITCEYDVHRMLSSVQKTCPGVDEVLYWVFISSTATSSSHLLSHISIHRQ